MRLTTLLSRSPALALLLAVSTGVLADAGPRWYGDLAIGVGVARDMNLDNPPGDGGAEFDVGRSMASLAIGRNLGSAWRVELEGAWLSNAVETLSWAGESGIRIDYRDEVSATAGHLNLIRDFRIGALAPYIGGGIGLASVELTLSEKFLLDLGRTRREKRLDDDDVSLAMQLIAGFSVPLSPKLELAFDYRLWHAGDLDFTAETGEEVSTSHTVHAGMAHLRYTFAGERPSWPDLPPPPAGGWALGASLGSGFPLDVEVEDSLENLDAFGAGPALSVTLGRTLSRRWRLELEAAWRKNPVQVVDFNPLAGQFEADGNVEAFSLMLNAAYRFRPERSIRPFLGAGAGVAWASYDIVTRGATYLDDSATVPALQLLAGLDIALSGKLDFVADFRTWYAAPVNLQRPDGSDFETSHWVNSINLGLRRSL